jgi:hypothetical protein
MRDVAKGGRRGRIGRRGLVAMLAWVVWLTGGIAHADERPPNIVLMLSDNLGFGAWRPRECASPTSTSKSSARPPAPPS